MERNKFGFIVSAIAFVLAAVAVLLSDAIQPGRAQLAVVVIKFATWLGYAFVAMVITVCALVALSKTDLDLGSFPKFALWLALLVGLAFLYPLGGAALDKSLFKVENSTAVAWTVYAVGQYLILSLGAVFS